MSLLFRIVYAAHAKGTHHKLALDALRQLTSPSAEAWQRLFLKHAEIYMQGSKAPDDEFKDFKNHVLHVRDGYWGGALDKAEEWYASLVDALRIGDWEHAVFSAGVLSHYVSDPIQPFHTGQSDGETNIHRAAEWSISRAYDDLRAQGLVTSRDFVVTAADGDGWLRDLVCRGAERANPHYEALIAHYNLEAGVSDPPSGLDAFSRKILGELLVYAAASVACALDRAFAEAGIAPPEVSLTLDTVVAAIKIPVKTLAKRLADAEDRRIVEAMYDELTSTGRVEKTLPEDDRVVRDAYEAEIAAPQRARLAAERQAVVSASLPRAKPASKPAAPPKATTSPSVVVAPLLAAREETPTKHYLAPSDDLERAPSIGPRTAERFAAIGVTTVSEFLAASADEMADALAARHLPADTLALWQAQCRLMLDIPGLRGTQAELLAQSGYTSAESIAAADTARLCADVLAFASTSEGKRLLREGAPPDIERIRGWVSLAQAARAAA
jgi:predicted flap endonuclease-1-like 5' DNA nuclease